MKRAIIIAAFGSASAEVIERDLRPIERIVAATHPDAQICLAFTSDFIIRRLREQGIQAESVAETIARLKADGFNLISVLPALVIPGMEYARLVEASDGCTVAPPLLASESDLDWMTGLLASIAEEEGRPLLVMGHGSDSEADEIYASLRQKLPGNIFLACFEGSCTLGQILPSLEALPYKQLTLMPLMLTAGTHALRDLAGDGEHSWKSILESAGFAVRLRLQGLGSLSAVQQRFAQKI